MALHGSPCGHVTAVKVQADNEYAASCKDGNYRVGVRPAAWWLRRSSRRVLLMRISSVVDSLL
jgi:hypothetical protein